MKLIWKGKFRSLEELPERDHPKGAVRFREPDDMAKLAKMLNLAALPLLVVTVGALIVRGWPYLSDGIWGLELGILAALLTLLPHELLHALCFRGTVQLYTNLKQGMLFVTGLEDMSRGRFVFMSLLPNLVFGLIPFVLFLIHPQWLFLGAMAAFTLPMGIGDYYNVYNCLTQVPKGALVYMSGMNSYWYTPEG